MEENLVAKNNEPLTRGLAKVGQTEYQFKVHKTIRCLDSTVRYVIWPEGAIKNIDRKQIDDSTKLSAIRNDILTNNRTWILGAMVIDNKEFYNTSLNFSLGKRPEVYSKKILVPFFEFVPLMQHLPNSFVAGSRQMITYLDNAQRSATDINIAICYETLFGEAMTKKFFNDYGIIFILSNEEWCKGSATGLMQLASLRAIESRKYVVRSTNQGISCVIDPMGSIKATSEDIAMSCLTYPVQFNDHKTVYMLHGDFLGKISLVLTLVSVISIKILKL